MKKINLLILFVFVLFGFILINSNMEVLATDKKVDNGKATYRVEQTIEEFDLGYGIHYQREKAFSSVVAGHHAGQAAGSGGGGDLVSGQEYQQQVNVLDIDFESVDGIASDGVKENFRFLYACCVLQWVANKIYKQFKNDVNNG